MSVAGADPDDPETRILEIDPTNRTFRNVEEDSVIDCATERLKHVRFPNSFSCPLFPALPRPWETPAPGEPSCG